MDRDVPRAPGWDAPVPKWRRRAALALFWSVVVGVTLLVVAFVALCIGGLVVMHANSAAAHPVLARFGLTGVVLVIGTVCAVFTAVLLRAYARMWRLRLRGVTVWATVTSVYVEQAADEDSSDTRHAIVRVDGLARRIDVSIWSGRPEVGERIRVRYLRADPTDVVQVRRTVGSAVLTVVGDGIMLYLLTGGLGVMVLLLALLFFGKPR